MYVTIKKKNILLKHNDGTFFWVKKKTDRGFPCDIGSATGCVWSRFFVECHWKQKKSKDNTNRQNIQRERQKIIWDYFRYYPPQPPSPDLFKLYSNSIELGCGIEIEISHTHWYSRVISIFIYKNQGFQNPNPYWIESSDEQLWRCWKIVWNINFTKFTRDNHRFWFDWKSLLNFSICNILLYQYDSVTFFLVFSLRRN